MIHRSYQVQDIIYSFSLYLEVFTIQMIEKENTLFDKLDSMDTRKVTFSHDSGQVIVDNSLGEANVSSFEFLSFDENFELIPIKDANRYEGMQYPVW